MKHRFLSEGIAHEVEIAGQGKTLTLMVDGEPDSVEVISDRPGELVLNIGGRTLAFDYALDAEGGWMCREGRIFRFDRPRPELRRVREFAGPGEEIQRSPMPALVVALEVAEGQDVDGGKTLLVIEAMKMETRVSAPPGSWRVVKVFVSAGQQVGRDQELVELAPRSGSGTGATAPEVGGGDDR